MNEEATPREILEFWFTEATRKLWFDSTPEFDARLRERYRDTWEAARRGELDRWMEIGRASCRERV